MCMFRWIVTMTTTACLVAASAAQVEGRREDAPLVAEARLRLAETARARDVDDAAGPRGCGRHRGAS